MKLTKIEKFFGSGFYSGYIPFAPGTMGSLAALVLYLVPGFEVLFIHLGFILVFTIWGIFIADKFDKFYGKDPKQCVIDEFVGTWISLLFIPKEFRFIVVAFIIWRILDITKPYPANKLENLKGGWGIMMDDVMSGIYTFIIMHIIIYFIN